MKPGWDDKTIGDVCEFSRGLTYAKGDEVESSNNVVLRANNIDLKSNLLDFTELRYINDGVAVPDSKKVRKNALIVCTASGSKSHLGKVAFVDQDYDYAFGGFMGMLTPRPNVLPRYLFHRMTSEDYRVFIGALSDGANINNLKFDDLRKFPIPIPPLKEQGRIVGVLDEAFAGLAIAQAHAEKNLHNARALFASHIESIFAQRGEAWTEKKLGEVCELINGRAYKKDEMLAAGRYPLLRVGNFFTNKDWYFSDLELEPSKYCDNGDLLYAWSASFGPRIWTGGKVIYHYHIWKVLPNPAIVEKRFLLRLLEWDVDQIKKAHGTGTTMMHVGKASMEARVAPIPPMQEQVRIVATLDALEAEIQRLERAYEQKLSALVELKKSLLHSAFSGAL